MRFRNALLVVLAACATDVTASGDLGAVHEWGTLTSVAEEEGSAMSGNRSRDPRTCRALSTDWTREI